ncbi:MAG: hypothetical protein MMC23_002862 [Stictis urceolatum]|nr:hypothetical protein [Stictis urceolata]
MSTHRTRGVGLSAFTNRSSLSTSYATHGAALRSSSQSTLQTQLSVFQSLLHQFALSHASTIRANPTFRAEFARMCSLIGVDPLAGSNAQGKSKKGRGWFSQVLGGDVGDFYLSVAVRVVEVCRASRGENGGLMGIAECVERVRLGRGIGGGMEVSEDDISRAVEGLGPLGSGFRVVEVGRKKMIRSVPKELGGDQATVLEACQVLGFVTVGMLTDNLGWEMERAKTVLDDLLADSMVWIDLKTGGEEEYWSPAFFDGPDEEDDD